MTAEQRQQANDQLRIDYINASADLTHHRRQARMLGEKLAEAGRLLIADALTVPDSVIRAIPTQEAVSAAIKDTASANDLVAQLRQELRDCGLKDDLL